MMSNKILVLLIISFMMVTVLSATVNTKACVACHGANFEKRALGKSKVIKDMAYSEIATALKGYKSGTYGGSMKGVMKGQVARYSDADLEVIASAITNDNDNIFQNGNFTTPKYISRYGKESSYISKQKKQIQIDELQNLLQQTKPIPKNMHKWLFVIGIQHYEYTDDIDYARRTAEMFAKVAHKKLGVPKQNSFILLDSKATQADIKNNFKLFLRRVKRGDSIYFYYNGHGIPIPTMKNEPFMLASNSSPDFISDEKFFSLQNIYNQLSNSKAKKVIAVIDSCFSGVTDGKAVLKGVAATRMIPKSVSFNKKKMLVLMAGNKHQFSNGYNQKGYRLFSFFVMRNILQGDKNLKKIYRNVKNETYETSLGLYGDMRVQSPTYEGNLGLEL